MIVTFQAGDRVRWETTGDDGLPLVRYGFVGGANGSSDRVAVMLDGELSGHTVVHCSQLAPVEITNVELHLDGADLLDDPSLRQALVNLWVGEADQAGLGIRKLDCLGTGLRDSCGYALAELWVGNEHYVLRASADRASNRISIRADSPQRWER